MQDQLLASIPAVGLVCVTVGTLMAVAFVPDDHRPAGAMLVPALNLVIVLLAAPILSTVRSPSSVFRAEYLIMIGLTYWILLDLLQAAYDLERVSRPAVVTALGLVGLFAAGVWIAMLHRAWRLPRIVSHAARVEIGTDLLYAMTIFCGIITLFRFALPCNFDVFLMFESLLGNRWAAPWARGATGGWDAFIEHLQYFGYLLPSMTVLLAHRMKGWTNYQVITSLILSLTVELFLMQGGGRRILGVTVGSAAICWVLLKGEKVRLVTLVVPATVAVILLIVMQTILQYRGVGYGKILEQEEVERARHLHVDDNFFRMAQITDIIPDHHPHTYEKPFVWAAIRPIPRALWPGKPLDSGFDLPGQVGVVGTSLTCSVLGEFYMSFGWPMVLLGGWMFGRLAGMCDQLLVDRSTSSGVLMFAISAMAIFAGLRSIIELVLMSYMLLAWLGLVTLFNLQPARNDRGDLSKR